MALRPLTIGLGAVVAVIVGQQVLRGASAPNLQTGPLVEQALRIYVQGGGERYSGVRDQLDALKPTGVAYTELTACSEEGYLLRRIESAKATVDYLDNPSLQGMNGVARLIYLERLPFGVAKTMRAKNATWPSHYDCGKREGATGWHMQDDREDRYAGDARTRITEAMRAEMEKEGPEAFALAEQRERAKLAVNHVIDDPATLSRARADAAFGRNGR